MSMPTSPSAQSEETLRRAKKERVVICGITGNQGGSVYDALKGDDDDRYELVGFSRTRTEWRGLELLKGDLADLDSLLKIFEGADYVFGMTQPWSPDYKVADAEGEIMQGANLIQACLECKVKRLIFSAAAHDGKRSGIPHVDSKVEIEARLKASGLSHTILHPVQFADNVGGPFFPIQASGWVRGFVDGDASVPYVACRDIGLATRAILEKDPSTNFNGQTIKLIGDLVSGQELAAIITKLRGDHEFRYCAVPRLLMRLFAKEFYLMRCAFEKFGRDPGQLAESKKDIDLLRRLVPELSSMEEHLKREGWATRALVSKEEIDRNEKKRKQLQYLVELWRLLSLNVDVRFEIDSSSEPLSYSWPVGRASVTDDGNKGRE